MSAESEQVHVVFGTRQLISYYVLYNIIYKATLAHTFIQNATDQFSKIFFFVIILYFKTILLDIKSRYNTYNYIYINW